jgi:hypothetical protein
MTDVTNPVVTATCGANDEPATVDYIEGMTVQDVLDEVGQTLNVYDEPKVLVNGAEAMLTTVVPAGAAIEFVKPSGTKG